MSSFVQLQPRVLDGRAKSSPPKLAGRATGPVLSRPDCRKLQSDQLLIL